jgi:hypothetical protein
LFERELGGQDGPPTGAELILGTVPFALRIRSRCAGMN